ncbi:MAG: SMC-Scp complex subunit ScpB [Porticoccaceae bacterium]|nr:SMC-Scp complex subunit ScpB [Porticoccaceae bacterium]
MNADLIKRIIEGALLAAGKPLDIAKIENLFEEEERPPRDQIRAALEEVESDCRGRGFELMQTASGYRFQVRQDLSTWVNRLWTEKPKRYSRAMLETLALIAYRQPLTRGDIEQVRGVAVSSDIIRTLQERDWVRVVGFRDVPGKPALYATTKNFLDYFNIKNLEQLPALSEIKDFAELDPELELALSGDKSAPVAANDEVSDTSVEDFDLQQQADGEDSVDDVDADIDSDDLISGSNS